MVHVVCFLLVLLVCPNYFHNRIPATYGVFVSRRGKALGHGNRPGSMINRDLVPDRGNHLFACVKTGLVVESPAITEMSNVYGTHHTRIRRPVEMLHYMVQLAVLSHREVNVWIVHFP